MIRWSDTLVGLAGVVVLAIVPIANSQVFVNMDFADELNGWTASQSGGSAAPGTISVISGQAVILEGDSFLVTLQQTFTVPPNPDMLVFDVVLDPGFDQTDPFIPDAFEVSLLDNNNASVVPTWQPQATAFFNLQEDGTAHPGSGAIFDGTTVVLDLSGVPTGTQVTLFFDLIGGDADTGSGLRIDNLDLLQEPGDSGGGGVGPEEENTRPTCDLNGPLDAECDGQVTIVSLEGAAFEDEDDDVLNFAWTTDCPNGTFDDPAAELPELSVDSSPGCSIECNVIVTLNDGRAGQVVCSTPLTISDTSAPALQCAADVSIACDDSRMPTNTGQSTATDECDPQPAVTFVDQQSDSDQPAISRVWSATDACGNSVSCTQTIALTDDTPPTITCPEDVERQTADPDGVPASAIALTASATDNCDGDVIVTDDRPEDFFGLGETPVVFTATDVAGNVANCTVMVTVTPSEESPGQIVPDQGSGAGTGSRGGTRGSVCGLFNGVGLLLFPFLMLGWIGRRRRALGR